MNRDEELAALRRPFAVGLVVVLLVVLAIGVVVAAFGSTADRPAGIAERWLVAVGDTTRDGVEDDARDRIEELSVEGGSEGAEQLLALAPRAAADERAAFEGVRVGRPLAGGTTAPDEATIPALVTPREEDPVAVYVALRRSDEGWQVDFAAPVADVDCGGECPGFPIERPERAAFGWFVGALGLGVAITVGCVAAVRAATPRPG